MKLYYYMGHEHLRENLQKKRVKVSRFGKYGTLNDPFELTPYDISEPQFRSVQKSAIEEVAKIAGLICLSKTRCSPAMWAHYAKNHTGVCLEFEVTFDHVFKVKYKHRKIYKGITLETYDSYMNLDNFQETLGTKAKDWEYEKEHRMFIPLDDPLIIKEKALHFMPFQQKKDNTFMLKRIWVGYRFELGILNIINDVKDYSHKVEVIQTRPAFKSFRVVKQREKKFWNMKPGKGDSLPAVQAVFDQNPK
jgi:DUF2971 family protein